MLLDSGRKNSEQAGTKKVLVISGIGGFPVKRFRHLGSCYVLVKRPRPSAGAIDHQEGQLRADTGIPTPKEFMQ